MSKQKTKITARLQNIGAAWAIRTDKFCDANDPLENCAAGRKTYHIHPDQSYPHWNSVQRFDTLAEIEDWLATAENRRRKPPSMKAQKLYDLREKFAFCSGTDLHEYFQAELGDMSPSGYCEIDENRALVFVSGCLLKLDHNSGLDRLYSPEEKAELLDFVGMHKEL